MKFSYVTGMGVDDPLQRDGAPLGAENSTGVVPVDVAPAGLLLCQSSSDAVGQTRRFRRSRQIRGVVQPVLGEDLRGRHSAEFPGSVGGSSR